MPYALYIDESGDFKENNMTLSGVRTSIVGGWMTTHDDDHKRLRKQLNKWNDIMSRLIQDEIFHATNWRKHEPGRHILDQVFTLTNDLKSYSVVFIENRSTNLPELADSTYLDMLVELIVNTIFHLLDSRKDKEAFPLQVYVAERKGIPDWEIRKLVQYRLRAVLSGSKYHHSVIPQSVCNIHIKALKKKSELINNAQSKSRDKVGLMPEMILADFLCNTLYQMPHFQEKPKALSHCYWQPSIYIPDLFWNNIQTYKKQKRWVEVLVSLLSRQGEVWAGENQTMSDDYTVLLEECISHVVTNLTAIQKLNVTLLTMIQDTRDFNHAATIIKTLERYQKHIAPHLIQTIKWNNAIFKLSIANHQGDNKTAAQTFDDFTRLFEKPQYQRTEFFQSLAEIYNRHGVAMTDRYEFKKTEKLLKASIHVEEIFLNTPFKIQDQTFIPQKSDSLGKIYSTLGQLYSKQAYREPEKAIKALACFDEAEKHMQQSFDPARQRNYRIEALLLTGSRKRVDEIYAMLTQGMDVLPETLFSTLQYNSFDTMYWLRWMLIPDNKTATPYKKALVKKHLNQFLEIDGTRYPEMSILYYAGKLAWSYNKKNLAIKAWNLAANAGRDIKFAGVIQTLALRPLCELILKNQGDDSVLAMDRSSLQAILGKIKSGGYINTDYFEAYFCMLEEEGISKILLEKLRKDIPYN